MALVLLVLLMLLVFLVAAVSPREPAGRRVATVPAMPLTTAISTPVAASVSASMGGSVRRSAAEEVRRGCSAYSCQRRAAPASVATCFACQRSSYKRPEALIRSGVLLVVAAVL